MKDLIIKLIRLIRRVPESLYAVVKSFYKRIYWYNDKYYDLSLFYETKKLQLAHPNPLNKYGKKCFSQSDEDGITVEILRRIGLLEKPGTYAEFGVGNGTENNTLILASLGWRGFWVGGETLAFQVVPEEMKRFLYIKDWITLDNITDLTTTGVKHFGGAEIDVISLDLDGNDIYFVEKLLSDGFKPKLFIVEYNGKFIPPVRFKIPYDQNHHFMVDDYFGASLTSFNDLFESFGYRLVCCNSHTGANAFFVDAEFSDCFSDITLGVDEIYVEPRYHLYRNYGHKSSVKTIQTILRD